MAQEVPQDTAGTVFDVVAEGLGDLGHLLALYHHALHDGDMDAMGDAQEKIEAAARLGPGSARAARC